MKHRSRRGLACFAGLLLTTAAFAHHETAPTDASEVRLVDGSRTPVAQPADTARLQVHLHDAEMHAPVAGLVRVTPLAGGAESLRLAGLFERPAGWFAMPPAAEVRIPPGCYRVEATRGIDTEISTREVECAPDAGVTLEFRLRRFHDPGARQLRSANTHMHLLLGARLKMGVDLRSRREVDDYLRTVGAADGVDLVYVSYLTQPGEVIVSNEYTNADLRALSGGPVLFANGVEHRHGGRRVLDDPSGAAKGPDGKVVYTAENSSVGLSYGHVMLLDLAKRAMLASLGPGLADDPDSTDGIPLRAGMQSAREQGGDVIWCHGSMGLERVPDWLAGLLYAQNIYDGGNQGTFDTVYYPLLNAGLKVPFSTGTDWGFWDFSRVYVLAPVPLTSRAFLRELAAGRTFITNEPLLEFSVEDATPGATISLTQPGALRIRGRAAGRSDFIKLQVVHNGRVMHEVASRAVAGHFEADLDFSFLAAESGWVALRILPEMPYEIRSRYEGRGVNILGKAIFAHTSPVYLEVAGRPLHDRAAIGILLESVEASLAKIEEVGVFADAVERDTLRAIYLEAEASLRELRDAAGGRAPARP